MSAQGRKGAFVVFCGEEGLEGVLSVVLLAVIITLRGLATAVVEVMVVGWATGLPMAVDCGGTTGLKLDGPVLNTGTGTVAVGANEMMGPVGKATLNLGRGSAGVKLAGGERLSGEALGGVSGA